MQGHHKDNQKHLCRCSGWMTVYLPPIWALSLLTRQAGECNVVENMAKPIPLIIFLAVLAVLAMVLALSIGSAQLSFTQTLSALANPGESLHGNIVWQLRLPRASSAFVVGGLLAASGVLMQVLLRNPLADPYILGVSGGAAVFALLAIMLGAGAFFISAGAFFGAVLSMLLVFALAHGVGGWNTLRLLLTGVVIAAGWGAVISFMLAISINTRVHGMLFWMMGDLSHADIPLWGGAVLVFGLCIALMVGRSLNLLARGDKQAQSLGVNVGCLRILLYFLSSLLSATAVTVAGSIGFIGLLAPHLIRLCGVVDHRFLLLASVLFGGTLLVLADTLARTLIAPEQLPVGVVTALLGVPLYLFILNRGMAGGAER